MSEDALRAPADAMSFEERRKAPLLELLPAALREELVALEAVGAGFRAGPGFVAGRTEVFPAPVPFAAAVAWIERTYRDFRRAHVQLVDGRVVFFDPDGLRSVRLPGDG